MTNALVADATPIAALPFTSAEVLNVGYGVETGEDPAVTGYRTAWWVFTPAENMTVTIDTQPTPDAGDTILALYSSSGPPHSMASLTLLDHNDDNDPGPGVWSRLSNVPLTAGTVYYLSVGAYADEDVTYVLRVTRRGAVKYDPALFLVERVSSLSGLVGEFIVGQALLGASYDGAWVPVPLATFSYSNSYSVDDNGTLIIDSESANVSLSLWDAPGEILYPLDRVRVSYDGKVLFVGTVDSTSLRYETDSEALDHGKARRVDFSATILGSYAIAMSKVVTFQDLPTEPAIDRVRRWVTVDNW